MPGRFTTTLAALACLVYIVPGWSEQWVYERAASGEWWRFLTASLVHYDLWHLITNLAAFLVLGTAFERIRPRWEWVLLTFSIVFTTILFVHYALPSYGAFAGISCVNYGFLGYGLCYLSRKHRVEPWGALLLIGLYSVAVAVLQDPSANLPRPVWQVHTLAFGLGWLQAWTALRRWGRRPVPRSASMPELA